MYEANTPLLLLVMTAFYVVMLRWRNPPRRIRLLLVASLLLFCAANWRWPIRLPIDRNVGLAINITSALLLFIVGLLTMVRSRRDQAGAPGR